jgi:hypothetical protein
MTRSLTMNDYRAEVWTAQKPVERFFSSSSCSRILGGRTDGTHGTDGTYGSRKSHRVSGRYARAGRGDAVQRFEDEDERYCAANAASTEGGKISMTSPSNRNLTVGS